MPAWLNPEQLDEAIALQRKGKTQQEIALAIGVERRAVSRSLNKYNRRVMGRLESRAVAEKGRQLDRLDYLYAQALEGWRRSCEDAVTVKTSDDGSGTEKTEQTVKGQAGDPSMIAQARAALADTRSILGLDIAPKDDAPRAVEVTIYRRDDAGRKPKRADPGPGEP